MAGACWDSLVARPKALPFKTEGRAVYEESAVHLMPLVYVQYESRESRPLRVKKDGVV